MELAVRARIPFDTQAFIWYTAHMHTDVVIFLKTLVAVILLPILSGIFIFQMVFIVEIVDDMNKKHKVTMMEKYPQLYEDACEESEVQ